MEQKFDGAPQAEIKLDGRVAVRTEVTGDWGSRLQWEVRKNGEVIATPNARLDLKYEHPDATPGAYELVLTMWKYVNYKKDAKGEFTDSKFVEVSNKVTYTI